MSTFLLLLTLTASTLVLRSGDRIKVDGPVREENGVVTFRHDGLLYSMPASETVSRSTEPPAPKNGKPVRRLAVSPEERDRRLRELEKNREGKPIAQPEVRLPPAPSRQESADEKAAE